MNNRPPRSTVPREQTVDLESLYPDVNAWERAFTEAEAQVASLAEHRGRLGEEPVSLLTFLHAFEHAAEGVTRLVRYAANMCAADRTNNTYQPLLLRARALRGRLTAATVFALPELLRLPDEALPAYLAAEPGLAPYAHLLDEWLSHRAHRLSDEAEAALAVLEGTLNQAAVMQHGIIHTDLLVPVPRAVGGAEPVSAAACMHLLESPDRSVRSEAYTALYEGLRGYRGVLSTTLAGMFQTRAGVARLRGYPTAIAASLNQSRIPAAVHDMVLDVLASGLAGPVQRYLRLRQSALGVDHFALYDVTAPITGDDEPVISFAEGTAMICDALGVLGPDYASILDKAFHERWIDWADNAGKSPDPFCSPVYGYHPVVMINWQGRLRDLFVLVHELGHAVHFHVAAAHQPFLLSGAYRYSAFFIEAPALCNEILLVRWLLAKARTARQIRRILVHFLDNFMRVTLKHLLQGELQRRLYTLAEHGQALTYPVIRQAQIDLLAAFYGDTVRLSEPDGDQWMLSQGLFANDLSYAYCAGFACAADVASAIAKEGDGAAKRWMATLRAGMSLYPLDLAGLAGVDMGGGGSLRQAVCLITELVDELERCSSDSCA